MSDIESRLRAALQDETIEVSARSSLADDMVQRGTTVRRRRRVVGGIAGLAALAAVIPAWRAIDTSDGSTGPVQQPSVSISTPPARPSTSTPPPRPGGTTSAPPTPPWSSSDISVAHLVQPTPKVVAVRTAQHGRYDRVVFDFDGAIPGYAVRLADALIADGSGQPIPVPGSATLVVVLSPTDAHNDRGESVLQGPARQTLDYPMVRGVVLGSDYEGVVSFGIGLQDTTRFRVFELTDPNRLVIDVHH